MARGPSKGYPYPSSSMVCDSWLFRAYFPHGWRREVDDTKQDVPLRGNGEGSLRKGSKKSSIFTFR